jgi:hypothetical protein
MLVTDAVDLVVLERPRLDRPAFSREGFRGSRFDPRGAPRSAQGPGWAASARERLSESPLERLARQPMLKSRSPGPRDDKSTLQALGSIAVEMLFEIFEIQNYRPGLPDPVEDRRARALNVPATDSRPPTLVIMDPAVSHPFESRRLTDRIDINPRMLFEVQRKILGEAGGDLSNWWSTEERQLIQTLIGDYSPHVSAGGAQLLELFFVVQPEIVTVPLPDMVPTGPGSRLLRWTSPRP